MCNNAHNIIVKQQSKANDSLESSELAEATLQSEATPHKTQGHPATGQHQPESELGDAEQEGDGQGRLYRPFGVDDDGQDEEDGGRLGEDDAGAFRDDEDSVDEGDDDDDDDDDVIASGTK